MRDYNRELKTLREQIARQMRNRTRLETLLGQEAEVQTKAERLCRQWNAELADVAALHIGEFRPQGMDMALDVLFDGILFDWMVLSEISSHREQVENLARQVRDIQGRMNVEFNETCQARDAARRELDELVERA